MTYSLFNRTQAKKGQVTLFILAGLAIIIAVAFASYMYVSSQRGRSGAETERFLSNQINEDNINSMVTELMSDVVKEIALDMAYLGGTYNPDDNQETGIIYGIGSNRSFLSVYARYFSDKGYENKIVESGFLRQNIQFEMERVMEDKVKDRINFSVYESQGFIVQRGDVFNISIRITDNEIIATLIHPVTLEREDDKIEFREFITTVGIPFGRLYGLAVDLTNDECDDGHVIKENYMLSLGNKVRIQKERNYPDIIYVLREYVPQIDDDLVFRFGIKGKDTVGKEVLNYNNKQGCCTNLYDGYKLKNVDSQACSGGLLSYNSSTTCAAPRNVRPLVTGCCKIKGDCSLTDHYTCEEFDGEFAEGDLKCLSLQCENMDCKDTFSGKIKLHGESWCEYDSRTGKGMDYPGSRHYLHSCINGVEYIEPCRDYREEMCAYQWGGSKDYPAMAACKINRWWDCSGQSGDACTDDSVRDCYYGGDYLRYNSRKCHPEVPPGFKFWEGNGAGVCSLANENRKGPTKKAYVWLDGTFFNCQRQGDCGTNYNYLGAFSVGGWGNRWGKSAAGNYHHPPYDDGNGYGIVGNIFARNSGGSIPSGGLGSDAWCSLWKPSGGLNCSLCNDSPDERPCTEYRCRSISPGCIFSYDEKGSPICDRKFHYSVVLPNQSHDVAWYAGESSDFLGVGMSGDGETVYIKPPQITTSLSPGDSCSSSSNEGGLSCKFNDPVAPHSKFNLNFKTEEDSECTISFASGVFETLLSKLMGSFSPSATLNELGQFSKEYNIDIRFPNMPSFNLDKAKIDLTCKNEFDLYNKMSFEVNISDNFEYTSPEVIAIEPSLLKDGNSNEVLLMLDTLPNYCYYYYDNSDATGNKFKCNFYQGGNLDEGIDLSTPFDSMQDSVDKMISLQNYVDVLNESSIDEEIKLKFLEGQISYDNPKHFGYYPCYTAVDIPSGKEEVCFRCEDINGTKNSKSQCFNLE